MFEDKMKQLVAQLREKQVEGVQFHAAISRNLETLGFWS